MINRTPEQSTNDFYATFLEDFKHVHQGYWTPEMDVKDLDLAQTRYLEELIKPMPIKEGDTILDLGCGNGGTSIWLTKKFGCFVQAIDIVEESVNRARQAVKNAGLEHLIHVHHMDAMEMKFEVGTFDHVIAVESIYHIEDKERLFKKVQEVLKPGGNLALAEYLLERPCSWLSYVIASDQVQSQQLKGIDEYYEMLNNARLPIIEAVDVTENTFIKFLKWNKSNHYEFYKNFTQSKYGYVKDWFKYIWEVCDWWMLRLAKKKIFKFEFIWCRNSK